MTDYVETAGKTSLSGAAEDVEEGEAVGAEL